jgi:hypothetical protein
MKGDVNDTLQTEGVDGVRYRHDNARRFNGTSPASPDAIKLKFFNELEKPSSKPWLIKNVIALGTSPTRHPEIRHQSAGALHRASQSPQEPQGDRRSRRSDLEVTVVGLRPTIYVPL